MAAFAILVGIGFFCRLLYGAAVYTLPFLVGAFVGLHAEEAGAGALGGIVLGVGAGVLVLIIGRAVFAQARGRSCALRSHWSSRPQPRSQVIP